MPRLTLPDEIIFPVTDLDESNGLSIREYMATHLLTGLLAARPQPHVFEGTGAFRTVLAVEAVKLADELITALNAQSVSVREDDGQPE